MDVITKEDFVEFCNGDKEYKYVTFADHCLQSNTTEKIINICKKEFNGTHPMITHVGDVVKNSSELIKGKIYIARVNGIWRKVKFVRKVFFRDLYIMKPLSEKQEIRVLLNQIWHWDQEEKNK